MPYKMFIDDERLPPQDGEEWLICRNYGEVVYSIRTLGFPKFISFDHDLGYGTASGYEIAQWIVNYDLNQIEKGLSEIPDDFKFYVHSQNPVGALNIESLLNNYLSFKKNGTCSKR